MKFSVVKDDYFKALTWLRNEIIIKNEGHYSDFDSLLIEHIYNINQIVKIVALNEINIAYNYKKDNIKYFINNVKANNTGNMFYPTDEYDDEIVEDVKYLLEITEFYDWNYRNKYDEFVFKL